MPSPPPPARGAALPPRSAAAGLPSPRPLHRLAPHTGVRARRLQSFGLLPPLLWRRGAPPPSRPRHALAPPTRPRGRPPPPLRCGRVALPPSSAPALHSHRREGTPAPVLRASPAASLETGCPHPVSPSTYPRPPHRREEIGRA